MLVYRLETEDGLGVYRGDTWEGSAWCKATNDNSHNLQLLPNEDGVSSTLLSLTTTRFGWHSVELYLQWVDRVEWRKAFEKLNVSLCVYQVEDYNVITRSCQCVFNINHATLIKKLSPLHFG